MLKRMYWIVAVVVVLSVAACGWIASAILSDYHDEVSRNTLLSATRIMADEMADGADMDQAAKDVASALDLPLRMTVVDAAGVVLYDDSGDAQEMENHRYRPEIAQALSTQGTASEIRYSVTERMEQLYLATYVPGQDLVVRAAMPLTSYHQAVYDLQSRLLTVSLIVLVVVVALSLLATGLATRPLVQLREAAHEIANGNYNARVPAVTRDQGALEMSAAFNTMAERLGEVVGDLQVQNARQDALLDSMGYPVLPVNDLYERRRPQRLPRRAGGRAGASRAHHGGAPGGGGGAGPQGPPGGQNPARGGRPGFWRGGAGVARRGQPHPQRPGTRRHPDTVRRHRGRAVAAHARGVRGQRHP